MDSDNTVRTDACQSNGHEPAAAKARALTTRTMTALELPWQIDSSVVQRCAQVLRAPGLKGDAYEQALGLLAAVIYGRPDLVGAEAVASLEALFVKPALPENACRPASQVLQFLLMTPALPQARDLLLGLLARPDLPPVACAALLEALAYATFWDMGQFDLATLVALAEHEHLAGKRAWLLDHVIERAMLARPDTVTAPLLKRLLRLYERHPCFKYSLGYLACQSRIPAPVRKSAEAALVGQFPLCHVVTRQLGTGARRVLVIQNIADKQGDEIIRVVPLLDALLRFNPLLEVVLVTAREYLYTHSRITLVPINDPARTMPVFQQHFDAVIDFYEPDVPQVNYDRELEQQVQAYVQTHAPFLYITSLKGWNHFVYQRVDVQSQPYADVLGLNRQRGANVYETTMRLIAELGLPLRLGEDPPAADAVLAGLPCDDAEAAWAALLEKNMHGRSVALVCPFGGVEPLKGYVASQADVLADQLRALIAEGLYVVLLPNGQEWGAAIHAQEVVARLTLDEQAQIMIAPDPTGWSEQVTYEHFGMHTVPRASFEMRLITYFVRFADLIVTVEGWMAHAAYCLGKRYRVLMLPYSHQSEWHPYGRTMHQDLVPLAQHFPCVQSSAKVPAPPLPDQPRKFVLLFVLRSLGISGEPRVVPQLRWALGSEDRDVRLAAVEGLSRFSAFDVDDDLHALLDDPAYRVRAVAATALLARTGASRADRRGISHAHLLTHHWIGQEPRDWGKIIRLGEGARAALETAMRDDDPVISREATQVSSFLKRWHARTAVPSSPASHVGARAALSASFKVARETALAARAAMRSVARRCAARPSSAAAQQPTVLILTPVKDAADCLDGYCRRIRRLSYPHHLISLGLLESDSVDTTFQDLQRHQPALRAEFRRVGVWKKDFGYRIPPGLPRWAPEIQVARRSVLAKSRNHLLFHALDDEAWVLWLDVDVVAYPPDLIEQLLAVGKDIVQPHCVLEHGGPTFDLNGWRDHGQLHLDDLRDEGDLVELDAVGGTVLFIRAELHRDGLIFPAFLYGQANPRVRTGKRQHFAGELAGEIETDGLGIMAHDMGYRCWGMPHLEVIHRRK